MEETPWLTAIKCRTDDFSAAGYLVMALEAARELFADREVAYVELLEVELSRAISFKMTRQKWRCFSRLSRLMMAPRVMRARCSGLNLHLFSGG